jgi:hypothetical protein
LPVADAGGPYAAAIGALVSVDGTGSRDPDGSVLDYQWSWGDELLVRAADLPSSALHGTGWAKTDWADAAGGTMFLNPDQGAAKLAAALAAPSSYVEFTVNATAGVPYYLWLRMRASNDSYSNDSLYLQFSGAVDSAGVALARIGTSSALAMIVEQGRDAGVAGWGWSDSVYDGTALPIYFANSGLQKIRIQQREDGVAWDQLLLSTAAHTTAPGLAKNDRTLLNEDLGTGYGVSTTHRYARPGTYGVRLTVTDAAGASGSATATVTVK